MNDDELSQRAYEALQYNDLGSWTRPAPGLYPHQWLWDSCFIAIGLAHKDPVRAAQEIRSIFRGQWSNGMVPHIVFSNEPGYHAPPDFWDSKRSPYAPTDIATSGITQPPLLAEAVYRVGKKLKPATRRSFYAEMYPRLVAYHEWLYQERDPHGEGLVLLIHPWETGMDNTPPWMEEMAIHHQPWWIKLVDLLGIDLIIERFRRDTRQVPAEERANTIETLMLYSVVRRLRRKHFDSQLIMLRSHFLIEDVFFNSILIRANDRLAEIAKELNVELPSELAHSMKKARQHLGQLWDQDSGYYYARNFVTHQPLRQPTIASLMTLYSGAISQERAKHLVKQLHDGDRFAAPYPVPTLPLNSPYFNHRRYWQGPTWINTNWLLIDGLRRYGYDTEADHLTKTCLRLVQQSGFHEYFSPVDGYGAGITPFSWTAALTIDLIESTRNKNKKPVDKLT